MAKVKKAPDPATTKMLSRNTNVLGGSFMFPPHVIDDIHIKAQLGRYRMRGFSLFKKIPSWDDLTFLPGTLTRFVIEGYREKCETKTVIGPRAKRPLVLDIPIYITGMSFGALSYEAKIALARGATMAGTATCSGEGGMIPDERRYSSKWFYQCIQSRYGFNPNHLRLADACEFFIGQGCKVGLGGHLMGQKVTDQVEEVVHALRRAIRVKPLAQHRILRGHSDGASAGMAVIAVPRLDSDLLLVVSLRDILIAVERHQRRVANRDRIGAQRQRLRDVAAVADAPGIHQGNLA